MAESGEHESLWFEDSPAGSSRRANRRPHGWWRQAWLCIAALAVPVAVALSSSGPTAKPAKTASSHLTRGVAEQRLISALSATTSSGSFNVSYEFDPALRHAHHHHDDDDANAHVQRHHHFSGRGRAGAFRRGLRLRPPRYAPEASDPCRHPKRSLGHNRPWDHRYRSLCDGRRFERGRTGADHPPGQRHGRLGVRWCRLRACPGLLGERTGCIALGLRRSG